MSDEATPTDPVEPGESQTGEDFTPQSLYRHPLAAVGGSLILAGALVFVVLVALDLTADAENPYRSLITFVGIPAIILIGAVIFLIGVRVQIANARRRGERVRFNLGLEFTNPRFRRSLWLFAGLSIALVGLVVFAGFQGYKATDSEAFCADACHTPMEPQAEAHKVSAHAKVECVECHIGPGGASWVQAKLDGIRQLWGVMTGEYDRPIDTPLENLHAADQLCESCHWPEHFKGEKFIDITHFATDEENSPWTVNLLVNVGGGPEEEVTDEGIHWHMYEDNAIEYIATDEDRQEIGWIRMQDADGNTVIYRDPDGAPSPDDPDVEVRRFDCLDCHNRPAHAFDAPGLAMDLAMARGLIDPELPFVKRIGLELLNTRYETKEHAIAAIRNGMTTFYQRNYASQMSRIGDDVETAIEELIRIYEENFFPEMNTDYRVRDDNAGHWTSDGCFRCHFSDLETEDGVTISSTCESCHIIVGQGPTANPSELEQDLGGLEFQHPVDIGELWRSVPCTQCHSPYAGY